MAAISGIIEHVPEAKESGLTQLCEYIEDCEHPSLLTTILHMLGERGPSTAHPSKYIRFIYNRLILENSLVRAAAVDALSKFGLHCEDLKDSIVVLLKRYAACVALTGYDILTASPLWRSCLMDGDDEVRDRVTFALTVLQGGDVAPVVNRKSPRLIPSAYCICELSTLFRSALTCASGDRDAPVAELAGARLEGVPGLAHGAKL